MAKNKGGMTSKNPFNQCDNQDPESGDLSGGGLYGSYEEVIAAQCSQVDADLETTPNSQSGHGVFGGPVTGFRKEPNPAGMSPTDEDRK